MIYWPQFLKTWIDKGLKKYYTEDQTRLIKMRLRLWTWEDELCYTIAKEIQIEIDKEVLKSISIAQTSADIE